MAELSKTAKASVVKAVKEVYVETTEEAIQKIRNDRAGKLFVMNMDRVDKLLDAYDALVTELKTINDSAAEVAKEMGATLSQLDEVRPVAERQLEEVIPATEKKVPAADIVRMAIAMATIPSMIEDPRPFMEEPSADSEAAI